MTTIAAVRIAPRRDAFWTSGPPPMFCARRWASARPTSGSPERAERGVLRFAQALVGHDDEDVRGDRGDGETGADRERPLGDRGPGLLDELP
jgi:hypothetical protein